MSGTKSKKKAKAVAPTVVANIATFDHKYSGEVPVFRATRTSPLGDFIALGPPDYNPSNRDPHTPGGGGTPLRDATMRMIRHLDAQRAPDVVLLGLLLDESGSMSPNRASVIAGVNQFVGGLAGQEAREGGRVLCVIFTDGHENSSVETSPESLRQVVAERENDGWTFIYMGANMDAWNESSRNLGISGRAGGQSVNFTSSPAGTRSAFGEMSRRSSNYLAGDEQYAAYASAVGNNSVVDETEGDVHSVLGPPPANPYTDVSEALKQLKNDDDTNTGQSS